MKSQTILFLLLLASEMLRAGSTYYISNTGSDSNGGSTALTPWKTISKINSSVFLPGDKILFKRGHVFYGSIRVNQDGLTFGSYGTGDKPIITGLKPVTSWRKVGLNLWESNAMSVLTNTNMLLLDGINKPMGRMPNIGYYNIDSHSSCTSIKSNSLSGTVDWTGAHLVLRVDNWAIGKAVITAQNGQILTFKPVNERTVPRENYGFFIQNDVRVLDVSGEWYYNPTTKKLTIYNVDQPGKVQIATIDTLLQNIHHNKLTVQDLSFKGSNNCSIYLKYSENVTIENCDFQFSGAYAIEAPSDFHYTSEYQFGMFEDSISCNYLTISNCLFNNTNDIAILLGLPKHVLIKNNLIQNTGLQVGMFLSTLNNFKGIMTSGPLAHFGTILNNKILNTGYTALTLDGQGTRVEKNYIDNFCSILDDGGGIYSYTEDPHTYRVPRLIKDNIVLNGIGAALGTPFSKTFGYQNQTSGIYIDASSPNFRIVGNTVANCDQGIFINNGHSIEMHGNTLYNNSKNLHVREYSDLIKTDSLSFQHNINFTGSNTKYATLWTLSSKKNRPDDFKADSNYYVMPLANADLIAIMLTSTYKIQHKTLKQWQESTKEEHFSFSTSVPLNNFVFKYNASSLSKTYRLNSVYRDAKNKVYKKGLHTLAPFTSVVLYKK